MISPSSCNEKMSSGLTDSLRTPLGVIKMLSSVLMDIAPPVHVRKFNMQNVFFIKILACHPSESVEFLAKLRHDNSRILLIVAGV